MKHNPVYCILFLLLAISALAPSYCAAERAKRKSLNDRLYGEDSVEEQHSPLMEIERDARPTLQDKYQIKDVVYVESEQNRLPCCDPPMLLFCVFIVGIMIVFIISWILPEYGSQSANTAVQQPALNGAMQIPNSSSLQAVQTTTAALTVIFAQVQHQPQPAFHLRNALKLHASKLKKLARAEFREEFSWYHQFLCSAIPMVVIQLLGSFQEYPDSQINIGWMSWLVSRRASPYFEVFKWGEWWTFLLYFVYWAAIQTTVKPIPIVGPYIEHALVLILSLRYLSNYIVTVICVLTVTSFICLLIMILRKMSKVQDNAKLCYVIGIIAGIFGGWFGYMSDPSNSPSFRHPVIILLQDFEFIQPCYH